MRILLLRYGFHYGNDDSVMSNEVYCMKNEKGQTRKEDNKDVTSVSLVVVGVQNVLTVEAIGKTRMLFWSFLNVLFSTAVGQSGGY